MANSSVGGVNAGGVSASGPITVGVSNAARLADSTGDGGNGVGFAFIVVVVVVVLSIRSMRMITRNSYNCANIFPRFDEKDFVHRR